MKTLRLLLTIGLLQITLMGYSQTAPVASSVTTLGEAYFNTSLSVGTTLTGSYVFTDANGDKEGTSTYNWYRSDASDGTGLSASLATTKSYTVVSADQGKYLYFEVTPIDDEPRTGTAVLSAAKAVTSTAMGNQTIANNTTYFPSDKEKDWNVSVGNSAKGLTLNSGVTYSIYGDMDLSNVNSGFAIIVNSGAHLILYGQLITKNNVDITVNSSGTFEVYDGLNAKNGSEIIINGAMDVVGDVAFDGTTTITVNSGAGLTVDGNLDIGNNAYVTVNGTVDVTGDLDTGSGSTILINGGASFDVGGDLLGNATIDGDGTMTVGGTVIGDITDLGPLPIELNYLKAYTDNIGIVLTWQTASELNNHYFTIERSVDAVNYDVVATISGAGNSTNVLNYSYADKFPLTGKSYYRLTQTDFDGKSKTFEPLAITYFNEKAIQFGPVPATNVLNINVDGSMGQASLKIINLLGSVVLEIYQMDNQNSIDVSKLPKGIYILAIEGGSSRYAKQIIIK